MSEESFDKLIITTGSWPIQPKIEGYELDNVVLSKNFEHSNTIIEKQRCSEYSCSWCRLYRVELVEAFEMNGKT